MTKPNILVIGVGNEYRGDDGIGLWIARQIESKKIPDVVVKYVVGDASKLFSLWEGFNNVCIVDAVYGNLKPGDVIRITGNELPLQRHRFTSSSHLYSLLEAIELANTIQCLPEEFVFYGVQVKNTSYGIHLSPEVIQGGEKVIHLLSHEILRHM